MSARVGRPKQVGVPRNDTDPPFHGDELVEWAEKYGHPEEWVKKAQGLHGRVEKLEAALEAAGTYIEHLKQHRHGACRVLVGPGHYECGVRLDYHEAVRAI
jgi:hypothetical protein